MRLHVPELTSRLVLSPPEKLSGRKLNVAEVTQSEIGQKQKLTTVLEAVNEQLRPHGWSIEWSVDCEWRVCFTWGPLLERARQQFSSGA